MPKFNINRIQSSSSLFALVVGVLSLVFIYYLVPQYINEPSGLKNPMMSPRWLPSAMGWGCFILSLALCLSELFDGEAKKHDKKEKSLHVLVLAGVVLSYIFFFEYLGAILTSIFAMYALFAIRSVRSIVLYGVAIILPFAVFFFFTELLEVPLPIGIFLE